MAPRADTEVEGDGAAAIEVWQPSDRDGVIEMILTIQRDEFELPITIDDQPDLVDVDDFYRSGGGEFWVARASGQVVGTIAAIVIEENTAVIRKMFLRADQRGSGLANQLMETLVSWARRKGYRTLLLGTTEHMKGAHRFYGKHGFEEIDAARLPAEFPRMSVDSRFFMRTLLGIVSIRPYNPEWPGKFEVEQQRITGALPELDIAVHHTGSTSVPSLAAKPIIDITMTVPDTDEEAAYVPALEAAGYVYVMREADWFGHRLMVRDWPRVNLHIFPEGCSEVDRMLLFRDWLRTHDDDRELYLSVKRELAGREWDDVQDYADSKTAVVTEIMERASQAADHS